MSCPVGDSGFDTSALPVCARCSSSSTDGDGDGVWARAAPAVSRIATATGARRRDMHLFLSAAVQGLAEPREPPGGRS